MFDQSSLLKRTWRLLEQVCKPTTQPSSQASSKRTNSHGTMFVWRQQANNSFFCKHSYLFLLQYATTKATDGTWSSEFANHAAALGALVNVSIHIFNSRWPLPCVLIRPTLSAVTTLLTSSHHSQFVPCFHTVVHTLASACFVPWPLCFFIGALISFDA